MKKRILKRTALFLALVAITIALVMIFIGIYSEIFLDTEGDERLFEKSRSFSSTVFYVNENPYSDEYVPVVAERSGSIRKVFYPLEEISSYIKDGFIAVEDNGFYRHKGIDVKRTVSAAVNYVFRTKKLYGASTITQQVVKNVSGDNQTSIKRKFTEILRAKRIERRYEKDDILEVYLNVIPMGGNMYGVGVASRTYFGKEPSELTAAEAATLIGVTNAPSAYSPYKNPEACVKKRNVVLSVMREHGIINDEEYYAAIEEPLDVLSQDTVEDSRDSWFVETVIEEVSEDLAKKYSLSQSAARLLLLGGGYSVYTTMDAGVQETLENFFENGENLPLEVKNGLNYAMTVVDSHSGNLVGIVGRAGEKKADRLLNHATAPHTPASVLKPIALYAPLIDEGRINWATVLDDVPTRFTETADGYNEYPHNSPNVYDGLITVSDALKYSKNTIATRLCDMRTPKAVYRTLVDSYGFNNLVEREVTDDGRTLTDIATSPMALGQLTRGESLLKLTESYAAFAADGVLKKARSYLLVKDFDGRTVLENSSEEKRIMKSTTARIMNKLLMGVTEDGTAKKITLKGMVNTAGKTGTSSGNKDKLFVGYTPYYTAGIWSGYDSAEGSVAALSPSHLEIWDRIMTEIHKRRLAGESSVEAFSDEGLIRLPFCRDSGKAYTENCIYDVRGERLQYGYFTADNRPVGECDRHVKCLYDSETKAIATEHCPRENLVYVSLLKIPERKFPKEIYITDAEYVYRNVGAYAERPIDYSVPYFYSTIPEGEYVGISDKRKQFNSNCYLHSE